MRLSLSKAFMVTIVAVLAAAACCLGQNAGENDPRFVYTRTKYKAAVYAHAALIPNDTTPVSRQKALETMEINLDVYRNQTAEAAKQNVDIIVLPEDGVYGMLFNRETVYPYLEFMPDPKTEDWNPCEQPERYPDTEVQQALSCMAKNNHIYLVANIGDKQPCDPGNDPNCREDKRYQYNTNVAYGPGGQFLARYHKHNLFYEYQFDTADPEYSYFDTPFGRFGMMTCFDIMFYEPAIPLVEKYHVTNMAFPTAWMDALPLLPAIGFHSSFARAHGINFLSSNIHHPEFRFDGTGLYAPGGSHGVYYGQGPTGNLPKLVVADMDVLQPIRKRRTKSLSVTFEPSTDKEFRSELFNDTYTFRALVNPSDKIKVCQGKICCELEYEVTDDTFYDRELFAFGAFDGRHTFEGSYYMQNCALVKCKTLGDRKSCGEFVFPSATSFSKIILSGQFETKYVYPQLVLSDPDGQLSISGPGAWTFDGSTLRTSESFNNIVLNAILVGRDYTRDSKAAEEKKDGGGNAGSLPFVPTFIFVSVCFGLAGLLVLNFFI